MSLARRARRKSPPGPLQWPRRGPQTAAEAGRRRRRRGGDGAPEFGGADLLGESVLADDSATTHVLRRRATCALSAAPVSAQPGPPSRPADAGQGRPGGRRDPGTVEKAESVTAEILRRLQRAPRPARYGQPVSGLRMRRARQTRRRARSSRRGSQRGAAARSWDRQLAHGDRPWGLRRHPRRQDVPCLGRRHRAQRVGQRRRSKKAGQGRRGSRCAGSPPGYPTFRVSFKLNFLRGCVGARPDDPAASLN